MIERDREIAEIRGECEHYWGTREYDCTLCETYKCKCDQFAGSIKKPYSTSIVHAMELWEEMKAEWGMPKLEVLHGNRAECSAWHEGIIYEGETEADAISGAWLKWKREGK